MGIQKCPACGSLNGHKRLACWGCSTALVEGATARPVQTVKPRTGKAPTRKPPGECSWVNRHPVEPAPTVDVGSMTVRPAGDRKEGAVS